MNERLPVDGESLRASRGDVLSESLIAAAEAALAEEDLAATVRLANQAEEAGAEADRCAGNRWLAAMLGGDFEAAWRESDAIRARGGADPHRFWQGEALCGKRVMLRSLHGFGDAVQMFRFLPQMGAMAADLTVEVPPRLVELAPCFDGMGAVITWGEDAPLEPPAWDAQVEVMELPYLLRAGAENLGPCSGYLRVPEALRAEAVSLVRGAGAAKVDEAGVDPSNASGAQNSVVEPRSRLRVGVVWTAGHWNPTRSIPFALVELLGRVDGCVFWSLEGRSGRERDAVLPAGWRDGYELGDGLVRLAAVVEQMDLVITVDTLAAHLAGALGVPCWVLLQHRADWRWMSGREDSPWYPSLRLWRQRFAGNWAGLMAEVVTALRVWVDAGAGAKAKAAPGACESAGV